MYQGKGGKETVVKAADDSGKVRAGDAEASAAHRPNRETWAPVEGVSNYADILSGPRNGWFVNTSGGVRDGMAFHIVHRGEKTFHVYGTGKHKQEIEVAAAAKKDSDSKAETKAETKADAKAETKAAGNTGGAAAPN